MILKHMLLAKGCDLGLPEAYDDQTEYVEVKKNIADHIGHPEIRKGSFFDEFISKSKNDPFIIYSDKVT